MLHSTHEKLGALLLSTLLSESLSDNAIQKVLDSSGSKTLILNVCTQITTHTVNSGLYVSLNQECIKINLTIVICTAAFINF
jgi:hypothetical protein